MINLFSNPYLEIYLVFPPDAEDPSIIPVVISPPLTIVFVPDPDDTVALAAADKSFWHDVRDTGTFICDTKSFIDVVPEITIVCFITMIWWNICSIYLHETKKNTQ